MRGNISKTTLFTSLPLKIGQSMQVIIKKGNLRQFVVSYNHQLSDFWIFAFAKQPKQKLKKNYPEYQYRHESKDKNW